MRYLLTNVYCGRWGKTCSTTTWSSTSTALSSIRCPTLGWVSRRDTFSLRLVFTPHNQLHLFHPLLVVYGLFSRVVASLVDVNPHPFPRSSTLLEPVKMREHLFWHVEVVIKQKRFKAWSKFDCEDHDNATDVMEKLAKKLKWKVSASSPEGWRTQIQKVGCSSCLHNGSSSLSGRTTTFAPSCSVTKIKDLQYLPSLHSPICTPHTSFMPLFWPF